MEGIVVFKYVLVVCGIFKYVIIWGIFLFFFEGVDKEIYDVIFVVKIVKV